MTIRTLVRISDGKPRASAAPLTSPPSMSEQPLRPEAIEPRWQAVWEREHTWEVSNDARRGAPKSYVLEMLPYPSGEPHMGHLKNYSVGDAVAHFHRRTGRRVLHPMGYDAFGLPAENHAIKTGEHPRDSTARVDRRSSSSSSASGASRSTGRASSAPTSRATTAGRSGSSCSCSSAAWPTARRRRSTGARRTRPCSPTSRSSTAAASAAARQVEVAPARAVVLPHHRLRRPAARRPRHDRVARARQDDAAQLDRPLRGRRGHVPLRGARHRLPGLHHAAGHAVRRDVLRHGARSTPTCCGWPRAPSTRRRSATTSTAR